MGPFATSVIAPRQEIAAESIAVGSDANPRLKNPQVYENVRSWRGGDMEIIQDIGDESSPAWRDSCFAESVLMKAELHALILLTMVYSLKMWDRLWL